MVRKDDLRLVVVGLLGSRLLCVAGVYWGF